MRIGIPFLDKGTRRRALIVLFGLCLNMLLAYSAYRFELPMYLDTAGTILAAVTGGVFPGMLTAVATNIFCGIFNQYYPFYIILGVGMALCVSWFVHFDKFKKKRNIIILVLLLGLLSGVLGSIIQWLLPGETQFDNVEETARLVTGGVGLSYRALYLVLNVGLNFVDKAFTTFIAFAIIHFIPKKERDFIWNSRWRQTPLTGDDAEDINLQSRSNVRSLGTRITIMLTLSGFALAFIMGWIAISLHQNNTKSDYTENAINAAKFAASVVDADKIDLYLREGKEAEGYADTENLLYEIRDSIKGVEYLYILRIEDDGCRFIFDLESDSLEDSFMPGDFVEFEEGFEPYLPALKAGRQIDPIETEDTFGWLLTAYYPVKNDDGFTVAYAGADVSMLFISNYIREFVLKACIVFSGFFVLIIGYGLWVTRYRLIYPIGSMARATERFMNGLSDQQELDKNVKRLRKLNIHTGDEVEELYGAICDMAAGTAEQMREIRYFAEATAKMQNGLIITMADMVENRDTDTGAHIQKTAAYVKIIIEGLKRKGYYNEKITDKYMSDVVMSAPLHDVGKINIPDAVLCKPGKLTDEEFEIMKSHTTAGKIIMEQAISTVSGENYLKEARNMAAYHHERWDGKGYPEGLHGQVIPLSARIMAVADVFDALTSPRVYKPAFSMEKALEIIEEGSGKNFDPKCVEVFMESLPEVKMVLEKYQEM